MSNGTGPTGAEKLDGHVISQQIAHIMTHPTPPLTTDRLILQPMQLSDAPEIQRLFPRWEVVRFLDAHVPWPYPPDGALSHLRDRALPAMAEGREWHWTLRPKPQGSLDAGPETLLGAISLMDTPDNNRGFWLVPEWRGHGLMTEACIAVTDFWFNTLNRPVLRVPKAVANTGSRRISERLSMRVISRELRDYVDGPQMSELWEITAEEWRRSSEISRM